MSRLLASLRESRHQGQPQLIISIEGGAPQETLDVAHQGAAELRGFQTIIHRQPQRLGLRNHILSLGDLSEEYGAVIVLEDDLVVDPYFYEYAQQSLEFYKDDEGIVGQALYSPAYNEIARLPFAPMANGYDTFLMQTPCSWGQSWSAKQWRGFRNWLAGEPNIPLEDDIRLPEYVRSWPASSWKKLFAHYMVETGQYFSYPYQAMATNCSAAGGTHIRNLTHIHQVPLASPDRPKPSWNFCPAEELNVSYDAYMEPQGGFVWNQLSRKPEEVEVDLYGTKPAELLARKPFALTIRPSHKPIARYPLQMRPIEMNLVAPTQDNSLPAFVLTESGSVRANHDYLDFSVIEFQSRIPLLSKKTVKQIIRSLLAKLFK